MTRQADFKRRVRARMSRTGESYAAARAQLLAERPRDGGALHVTNGDSTVAGLRPLVGDALPWRDVLHEGPVPAVGEAELRRVRAAFLGAERALPELAARDAAFAAHRDGRYVLWFEADLYDQLQLAQILARLAALAVAPERITLICIGEHPGIAHFGGLGELASAQLAALRDSAAAAPLTAAALALGSARLGRVPRARARRPRRHRPRPQPGAALPARGLRPARPRVPLDARRPVAHGAPDPRRSTPAARRDRPGERVRGPRRPRGAPLPRGHVRLRRDGAARRARPAAAGRRAAAGRPAHAARAHRGRGAGPHGRGRPGRPGGIDRWIGGVHLQGRAVDWRWDDATEQIVRARR